ncbi:MAG: TIGR00159 family protein [Proteobacteria bacterium]|nr:TIGR00159 family protein [Pseudomonadota bacterium]
MLLFISLRFLDIVDILLVAFLLYQLYFLIRGTVAINIFAGIFLVYLLWLLVRAINMSLLSTILGSFIGLGVLAVIIVFQQEIRRFLLLLGTQDIFNKRFSFQKYFGKDITVTSTNTLREITRACRNMAETKTGALIVFTTRSELVQYIQSGDVINAIVSHRLLESLFFKNSPMHDGAVIIVGDGIKAARCVLPIDDDLILPASLGLRHRAAISMSNETDAVIVTVSEETGYISYAKAGTLKRDVSHESLYAFLKKEFIQQQKVKED